MSSQNAFSVHAESAISMRWSRFKPSSELYSRSRCLKKGFGDAAKRDSRQFAVVLGDQVVRRTRFFQQLIVVINHEQEGEKNAQNCRSSNLLCAQARRLSVRCWCNSMLPSSVLEFCCSLLDAFTTLTWIDIFINHSWRCLIDCSTWGAQSPSFSSHHGKGWSRNRLELDSSGWAFRPTAMGGSVALTEPIRHGAEIFDILLLTSLWGLQLYPSHALTWYIFICVSLKHPPLNIWSWADLLFSVLNHGVDGKGFYDEHWSSISILLHVRFLHQEADACPGQPSAGRKSNREAKMPRVTAQDISAAPPAKSKLPPWAEQSVSSMTKNVEALGAPAPT